MLMENVEKENTSNKTIPASTPNINFGGITVNSDTLVALRARMPTRAGAGSL